ncbi:MAG TPA: nitroreductase family protein [Thermoanaerobaculaceae bacterium]|nr:nitroreductase family protein [Thermoanaerobaculaceae bacterium]HPS79602.1 nitroreductase family protein [Thermoanaerobaculaceae bacterium]
MGVNLAAGPVAGPTSLAGSDQILPVHRSIREYRPDPIPAELLVRLLTTAQHAPTDATAQMATLIRVADPELRARIARLSGEQDHILTAPEFFVVCADLFRLQTILEANGLTAGRYPASGLHFATVDAALVAQRLVDAAEICGLGICCIGGILDAIEEVVELLVLPSGVVPLFGLCLGWPAEEPQERPRVALDSMVYTDRYGNYAGPSIEQDVATMAAITSRGDWLNVLATYFGSGGVMEEREWPWRRVLARQGFASWSE